MCKCLRRMRPWCMDPRRYNSPAYRCTGIRAPPGHPSCSHRHRCKACRAPPTGKDRGRSHHIARRHRRPGQAHVRIRSLDRTHPTCRGSHRRTPPRSPRTGSSHPPCRPPCRRCHRRMASPRSPARTGMHQSKAHHLRDPEQECGSNRHHRRTGHRCMRCHRRMANNTPVRHRRHPRRNPGPQGACIRSCSGSRRWCRDPGHRTAGRNRCIDNRR